MSSKYFKLQIKSKHRNNKGEINECLNSYNTGIRIQLETNN